MKPDYQIAMAAGKDAANRNMRANHRTAWNKEDWNIMCEVFDQIMELVEE